MLRLLFLPLKLAGTLIGKVVMAVLTAAIFYAVFYGANWWMSTRGGG